MPSFALFKLFYFIMQYQDHNYDRKVNLCLLQNVIKFKRSRWDKTLSSETFPAYLRNYSLHFTVNKVLITVMVLRTWFFRNE